MELSDVQKPENRLPLPGEEIIESTDCLIESIWGHRLWHRQSPWLIFLEFLNVAESLKRENISFANGESVPQNYRCRRRIFLRHLLFRNSELDQFAQKRWSESDFWTKWFEYFAEKLPDSPADPTMLKGRFAKFTDFAAAVRLLRETVVHSTSRWTSSFVFPFGPAGLYEDLDVQLQSDRSNFGRTGELLYLMLQRSGRAAEISAIVKSFLNTDSPNNALLEKLQPEGESEQFGKTKKFGYLPYKAHPAFTRLAEDWLSISKLGLPGYDAYEHYTTLASFHVLMYHVETAASRAGDNNIFFVCEVLAPRMEAVRQLSIRSFQHNEGRAYAAVQKTWNDLLDKKEWKEISTPEAALPIDEQISEALQFFKREISFNQGELPAFSSVADLQEHIRETIERKLEDNIGTLHRDYGRDCGFVSKRGTRNYRYAPTDSFLKTLVLANVDHRMEMRDFLRRLFVRYHLVLGPEEAELVKGSNEFEGTVFKKNAKRLEDRLKSMGMLNRLSDGVAFVENPVRSH